MDRREMSRNRANASSDGPAYLEHYLITWSIKNFKFLLCCATPYIGSPLLYLENSLTVWRLFFNKRGEKISIGIWRLRDRDGPDAVEVNCQLSLKIGEDVKIFCQGTESFVRTQNCEFGYLLNLRNFLTTEHSGQYDELLVICEMFILLPPNPTQMACRFEGSPALEAYSSSLLALYESGIGSTTTLRTSNGKLDAHAAILLARCPSLKTDSVTFFSEIRTMPKKIVDRFLRYLYSGNFEFFLSDRQHLLTLCLAAEELDIPALNELFAPKQIHCSSAIEVENMEYKWPIENCVLLHEDSVKSPLLKTHTGTWQFALNRSSCGNSGEEHKKFFDAEISFSDFDKEICASLEISIKPGAFSSNSTVPANGYRAQVCRRLEPGEKIKFLRFVDESAWDCSGPYCVLTVDVNIKVSSPYLSFRSIVTKTVIPVQTPNIRESNLQRLSADLFYLLDTLNVGDTELNFGTSSLAVHRPILIARSPSFADLIDLAVSDRVFSMRRTYPDTAKKILEYVYCGQINLNGKSIMEVSEMCYVANLYKLPSVREVCYSAFKSMLNVHNVHTLLLWAVASYSEQIKALALNFIKKNARDVFRSYSWQECKELYPDITSLAETWAAGGIRLP